MTRFRSIGLLIGLAAALALAGCGSSSPTASRSPEPLHGNGVTVPLPSDTPSEVRSLPVVFSCGGQELEGDAEEAPAATQTTAGGATIADPGGACLIRAFDQRRPAQYVVSEGGNEGEAARVTIYRVVGDGSIVLYVRAASSGLSAPTWNRLVCHGIALTDEGINPDGCAAPVAVP